MPRSSRAAARRLPGASHVFAGALLAVAITTGGSARAQEPPPPGPTPPPPPPPAATPPPVAEPPAGADAPTAAAAPPPSFERPALAIEPPELLLRPADPPPRRRSTALMVTGIVSTALGAVALAAGSVLYAGPTRSSCASGGAVREIGGEGNLDLREHSECAELEGQETAGLALMIGGGAGIALGVPLLVVGATRAPAKTGMGISPRSVSLRFRF